MTFNVFVAEKELNELQEELWDIDSKMSDLYAERQELAEKFNTLDEKISCFHSNGSLEEFYKEVEEDD